MKNSLKNLRLIADMHTHTIASTHAYSTILENARVAKERGLKFLAITDHSEKSFGGPREWYFENLKTLPAEIDGVKILSGIECNILSSSGELDFPIGLKKNLDWVVASIHRNYFDSSIASATETWLNVAEDKRVNVIAHSGSAEFTYDYEKVIPIFGKNHKLVEINNATFNVRKGNLSNCKKIALMCKRCCVPVIVDTDSHFCTQVGDFSMALELLDEIDFPPELIVNADYERMNNYIKEYSNYYKN